MSWLWLSLLPFLLGAGIGFVAYRAGWAHGHAAALRAVADDIREAGRPEATVRESQAGWWRLMLLSPLVRYRLRCALAVIDEHYPLPETDAKKIDAFEAAHVAFLRERGRPGSVA